jgi:hypothetical protein
LPIIHYSHDINVPNGLPAHDAQEAFNAAQQLGTNRFLFLFFGVV